jgi:small subunit ribosomal protein S16
MLAIRMQRTGRKGHAMFRMVVQDARRTPTSGKVVAQLGSYDPHAKTLTLNKEKISFYLEHGAQPSDRVAVLLKKEGVKLPTWVTEATKKERSVRNPDKRRSTRPAEPEAEAAPAAEEAPAASDSQTGTDENKTESPSEEIAPAENEATEEPAAAPEPEASDEEPKSEPAAEAGTEESPAPDADAPAEPETETEASPKDSEDDEKPVK